MVVELLGVVVELLEVVVELLEVVVELLEVVVELLGVVVELLGLVVDFLSVRVVDLSVATVLSVVTDLSVADFGQAPLKGSVFGCVPNKTVFPRAGSKNAVLLFAGSWA